LRKLLLHGHGVQYTLGCWCQRYQAESMERTQGNTHHHEIKSAGRNRYAPLCCLQVVEEAA
jgi:hypothetical protein